ncbi:DUF6333 family protein [Streptomyces boluensis]|uniref:Uncharacterized protein n=1 Tax=Streptomyces boluensis TaxID=1775135 RepID=A0A964XM37_9ACTN|nr:DUF6333 family protein [Streptomyces boluensis]NBE52372.1 hypothetical protein [Streptomyces boluensis]
MTETAATSSWCTPADEADEEVAYYGEYCLTVVRHVGTGPAASGVPHDAGLPAHDPVAARRFAESFGTIEKVVDDLGTVSATEGFVAETRADLELVRVGCWGDVIEITDPGLIPSGYGTFPVDEEADALAERFPDAVVIASCSIDYNMPYGAWKIIHPGGARLFVSDRAKEGEQDVEGSVADVVNAFGITAQDFADEDLDEYFHWDGLCDLALGKVSPLLREGRELSVFRVAHTEDALADMEEMLLGD